MPTYAYRCPRCAHAFERFHKMNDDAPHTCPECGATAEQVITGGTGFVFKGSGFYATDYKRSPGEKDAGDKERDAGDKERDAGDKEKDAGDKERKKTGDTKDSSSKPGSDSGSSKSSGGDAS